MNKSSHAKQFLLPGYGCYYIVVPIPFLAGSACASVKSRLFVMETALFIIATGSFSPDLPISSTSFSTVNLEA